MTPNYKFNNKKKLFSIIR